MHMGLLKISAAVAVFEFDVEKLDNADARSVLCRPFAWNNHYTTRRGAWRSHRAPTADFKPGHIAGSGTQRSVSLMPFSQARCT